MNPQSQDEWIYIHNSRLDKLEAHYDTMNDKQEQINDKVMFCLNALQVAVKGLGKELNDLKGRNQ